MAQSDGENETPVKPICDDSVKSEARLNVLYSPFRKREVNPQDWESKMSYWKDCIDQWCFKRRKCIFTLNNLQSEFVRNGRPAMCLSTVLENMLSKSEVIHLQDLLNRDPSLQSWSTWAVNLLLKTPVVWSFNKLKDSIVAKSGLNEDEEFVYVDFLKVYSRRLYNVEFSPPKTIFTLEDMKSMMDVKDEPSVKAVLHWMQLQGEVSVRTVSGRTIYKLAGLDGKVTPLTDTDVGVYQLQQNEHTLVTMLEQLEKEKQQAEGEARSYLKKGMRQMAKTCLRKKKELEKCISKRASALENVQVLLSRVREAESDKEILDSYKMGLSALKSTFKDAGLSEEGVNHTMDRVKEVLEAHEEIQSALSEPMADSVDADLESELAELLGANDVDNLSSDLSRFDVSFSDLPEPPSHSPTSSVEEMRTKLAQSTAQ